MADDTSPKKDKLEKQVEEKTDKAPFEDTGAGGEPEDSDFFDEISSQLYSLRSPAEETEEEDDVR